MIAPYFIYSRDILSVIFIITCHLPGFILTLFTSIKISCFAQTAYAFEDDKERAIISGCDDYISKPIKVEKLLQKIAMLMSMKNDG
ncbi:MAG: hypothetical protein ACOCW8_01695 [bacterium]